MSLKETILGHKGFATEALEVPEWNTTVHVRELTLKERQAVYERIQGANKLTCAAWVAVFCVVDEDGNRVFAEKDFDAVCGKSAKILERIQDVAFRLSGLNKNEKKESNVSQS